jgi:hypothetical protein
VTDFALILPPPPARRPRSPRVTPVQPGVECPAPGTRPAIAPPPVLDAIGCDAEWLAFCDERRDDAVEHQDADPDAEWADLPEWMGRCAGTHDGAALGVGEVVGGRLVWSIGPRGDA